MNPAGMSPQLMNGFLWSVAFLAVMPYVLLAFIGGGLYRAKRREQRNAVRALIDETTRGTS